MNRRQISASSCCEVADLDSIPPACRPSRLLAVDRPNQMDPPARRSDNIPVPTQADHPDPVTSTLFPFYFEHQTPTIELILTSLVVRP